MEYSETRIGRSYLIRLYNGEDLQEGIRSVVEEQDISFASIDLIGAVSSGKVVVGPVEDSLPVVPVEMKFYEPHEITASGNVLKSGGRTMIHLHGTLGRKGGCFSGCLRDDCRVFITVEIVLTERLSESIDRVRDEVAGVELLHLKSDA